MKMYYVFLVLILSVLITLTPHAECPEENDAIAEELLKDEPWEGIWHTHDTSDMPNHGQISGEHFHATHKEVEIDGCLYIVDVKIWHLHKTESGIDPQLDLGMTEFTDDDDPVGPEILPENNPTEAVFPKKPNTLPSTRVPEVPDPSNRSPEVPEVLSVVQPAELAKQPPGTTRQPEQEVDAPAKSSNGVPPSELEVVELMEADAMRGSQRFEDLSAKAPLDIELSSTLVYRRKDVVLTEYMLNASDGLPQWIEIYNTTPQPIKVQGWKLNVWQHDDRERVRIIGSSFTYIPPKGFLVLVNKDLEAIDFGGINPKRVKLYQLRELKRARWIRRFRLFDSWGNLITHGDQYVPQRPALIKGKRSSYDVVNRKVSRWHKNQAWIGSPDDRSTLGWHNFPTDVPASPRHIRTKSLSWGSLKKPKN